MADESSQTENQPGYNQEWIKYTIREKEDIISLFLIDRFFFFFPFQFNVPVLMILLALWTIFVYLGQWMN